MTNADLQELMQEIAETSVLIVRNAEKDKARIDDGLWNHLVSLYDKVEEYV